jgi:hypothetical protein
MHPSHSSAGLLGFLCQYEFNNIGMAARHLQLAAVRNGGSNSNRRSSAAAAAAATAAQQRCRRHG